MYEAGRYVENNPVAAKMVRNAWSYRWSSAKAHLGGKDDGLVKIKPLLARVENWRTYLQEGVEAKVMREFEKHEQRVAR